MTCNHGRSSQKFLVYVGFISCELCEIRVVFKFVSHFRVACTCPISAAVLAVQSMGHVFARVELKGKGIEFFSSTQSVFIISMHRSKKKRRNCVTILKHSLVRTDDLFTAFITFGCFVKVNYFFFISEGANYVNLLRN